MMTLPFTLIDLYLTVGVVTALLILAFALKALTNPIVPAVATVAAVATVQMDSNQSEAPPYAPRTIEDRELVPA